MFFGRASGNGGSQHELGVEDDRDGRSLRYRRDRGGGAHRHLCSGPHRPWTSLPSAGAPVNVVMQTVGTYGSGTHPPGCRIWSRHPAASGCTPPSSRSPQHTRVNVTIYQYDSGSPLRNQQLGQVTGTSGTSPLSTASAFRVIELERRQRGRVTPSPSPRSVINVPLWGNNGNANLCASRAVHHQVAAQDHPVLLHQSRSGQLPLAVLRALRRLAASTATAAPCRPSGTWAAS